MQSDTALFDLFVRKWRVTGAREDLNQFVGDLVRAGKVLEEERSDPDQIERRLQHC
jgi:hypothetical protein